MYKKLLVPLDGSPTAEAVLPLVRSLAVALTIPVELLGVVETIGITPDLQGHKAWYLGKFVEDAQLARETYLSRTSRLFPEDQVTWDVAVGTPADVVLAKGAAQLDTLVAIATHGRSGINRWLLGSVAEKLLTATRNPLLVIRAPRESAHPGILKSIIVPLDGSALAEKILPHVIYLAQQLSLDVHLVRVFTLPPDVYLVGDGLMVPGPVQFRDAERAEAQAYVDGKAQELREAGLGRVITTSVEGDPASEIIDLANTTADALVAMSTHGRSGVGHWVLGSVTEKVIRYGKNPVLVIRPE